MESQIKITKRFIQYGGFPIVAAGLTALLFAYPGALLPAYAGLATAVALGAYFERVLPYDDRWNRSNGDTGVDLVHAIVTVMLGPLVGLLVTAIIAALRSVLPAALPVHQLPLALQVVAALIVSGLLPYWLHRKAHERDGFLWRVHSVHHSASRLYWLNALRAHPFNVAWNGSGLLLTLLFGFSAEAVFVSGTLNNFVTIFNHLNVDFRLGPLNWVINMNELHRWHHSNRAEESNANYSSGALTFWDVVFGTRFLPKRRVPADAVGLFDSEGYPLQSYLRQLCFPICRCA